MDKKHPSSPPPAAARPTFTPTPQLALVAYLELVLERARVGEVQFFVGSAGLTPAGEPTGFDVQAYAALGDRIPRLRPADRSAAYVSTLEGLASANVELQKAMDPLLSRIVS